MNKDILSTCLNAIKNESHDKISAEIDKLIKIFGNFIDNNLFNKEQIINKIEIISKRDDINEIVISIRIFIERTKVKKGKFFESICQLILILEDTLDENEIIKAENFLKEDAKINVNISNEKENNIYLNILKMFREHPNSLTFLIDRTQDDCDTLKELVGEDDSGLLNINHILDLEKCFNFMNSIRNGKNLNKIR